MLRRGLALLVTVAACGGSSQATAPKSDASAPRKDVSTVDAAAPGLPDGALVYVFPLPECQWPSGLSASRTFLACAGCFTHTYGGGCSIGVGDNATDCQSCGPCVMACDPDQFAVVSQSGPFFWDAGDLNQTLPAGCVGELPIMQSFLDNYHTSIGIWTVTCCPCQ